MNVPLQILFSLILPLLLFCSSPIVGEDWALKDSSKGWNSRDLVSLYFHNSELQTQWAWQALSHYSFRGNERILDFGAGDGKLSAMMSFIVAQGTVTGLDLSEEMSAYASKMFPRNYYKNLTFIPTKSVDFEGIFFPEKFDVVTSFCVFHLVPNPVTVLRNIKQHMNPNSKFILTFPIGGNLEFSRAASEEMRKRGWNLPSPTDGTKDMRDPSKIRQIFDDAGFDIEHFQVIDTRNSFSTKEEMTDWFEGTLTANWDIPLEGRRDFFSNLTDLYLMYRPQDKDEDGFVYFTIKRVDLLASPSS